MIKKIVLLLVLALAVFTFSCGSDDDVLNINEPTLEGSWSLVNVFGGFAGIDDDYENGIIVWDFNLETQQVTVTNTNMEVVIFDGLPTGVYDFEVLITEEDRILVIDFFSFNLSVLTAHEFILDQGAYTNDGFQLTFNR
ncbi:hypothetical protein [Psychroserpens damuponensis]|uniref:hypothetical protein n=1 Tax=Psychroserpens damuponensis TaxID=943936 RepID=UPI000590D749|nr:hypothetical protein [Psychroserpens damuponensis]